MQVLFGTALTLTGASPAEFLQRCFLQHSQRFLHSAVLPPVPSASRFSCGTSLSALLLVPFAGLWFLGVCPTPGISPSPSPWGCSCAPSAHTSGRTLPRLCHSPLCHPVFQSCFAPWQCNFWVLLAPLCVLSLLPLCPSPAVLLLCEHSGAEPGPAPRVQRSSKCSQPASTAPGLCRNTHHCQHIFSPSSGNACQLCGTACKSLASLVKKAQSIINSGIIQHCPT